MDEQSVAEIEELLADTSHAIDTGDYTGAVDLITHAAGKAQSVFGDNADFAELRQKMTEIQDMLGMIDGSSR